jgi:hypothetical protein
MHGRPMLGKHRMVTVATRIEPSEVQKLKDLAGECGVSVCAYLRELVRLEFVRSERSTELNGAATAPHRATGLVQ